MSLHEQLAGATNRVALLKHWISQQPDRDEWLEVLRRGDLYSLQPIVNLLKARGHETTKNSLHRVRVSLEGYVSAR